MIFYKVSILDVVLENVTKYVQVTRLMYVATDHIALYGL